MNNKVILEKTLSGCRSIIFNRPHLRNAFSPELAKEMLQALQDAGQDPEVRVVIIRGSGGCFSAGGDLKLLSADLDKSDQAFRKISKYLNQAIQVIRAMPKPVIAAVEGPAYAAAFGLVLACDLVLASTLASLSPSFVKMALAPNASTTYFLPRIVGMKKATEILLRGEVLSATKALELGIVGHVWDEENFDKELENFAKQLAKEPESSITGIKKLLNKTNENSLEAQLELERETIAISSLSADFKERVQKFLRHSSDKS